MISVVIFTSNLFLPSLTRTSLSHTHCLCQAFTAPTHTPSQREPPTPTHHDPSSTQPSFDPLRSAHDSTQPSSDPLRSAHDPSSTHSTKIAPIHSDPLTIQARRTRRKSLRSTHDPLQALDENRSDPLRSAHDPSSDSVDAHDEFSFSVSHSDLIFLRSTLISPVHCFSISGRQPHFSDPQIITSVLTPTHCDACSLFFFYYYI